MAATHDTGFVEFRASGGQTLAQAQRSLVEAIVQAREAGMRALLAVLRDIDFASPGLAQRHVLVREWADAAQGRVRIALVLPAQFIDDEKFGVVAAANFGLHGNVFTTETDARDWLLAQR
jgi:hypothetical protein